MGRRLSSTVVLHGDDGATQVLVAGSEPTSEQAGKISNPDVWETEEEGVSAAPESGVRSDPAAARASKGGRRAGPSED